MKSYEDYWENEDAFFILGTNYWGALNEAYSLNKKPDTVNLIAEPRIASPSIKKVERAYECFDDWGRRRPGDTKVIVIALRKKAIWKGVVSTTMPPPRHLIFSTVEG